MERKRLSELFRRYYAGQLGPAEETEFFQLVNETTDEELTTLTRSAWEENGSHQIHFSPDVSKQLYDNIMANRQASEKETFARRMPKSSYAWIAAASVVLLTVVSTILYQLREPADASMAKGQVSEFELFAGGNQVVLTADDGQHLVLDSTYDAIHVTTDGLRYGASGIAQETPYATRKADVGNATAWHTLTVPRGGQYNITLADGTRVWLNAASTIRFPSKFTDNQRIIELNGEAYLEVKDNARAPFSVVYQDGKIEVLGTRFNIRAYQGQPTQTALIAGAVRMVGKTTAETLVPGQVAKTLGDRIVVAKHTSIEDAIAWKSGLFVFEDASLQSILKDIERWYDITVAYNGLPPSKRLTGTISQHVPLGEVLQMLRFSGVECTFESRTLTIL